MESLLNWATLYNISPEALSALDWILKYPVNTAPNDGAGSEAGVSQRCRLKAPYNEGILWRNNVGVLINDVGVPVRFGLANDSKKVNESIKSNDLIGITTVEHAGRSFGVFTSVESKAPQWTYKGTDREIGQLNYINIVRKFGGIAGFATSAEDYDNLISGYKHE